MKEFCRLPHDYLAYALLDSVVGSDFVVLEPVGGDMKEFEVTLEKIRWVVITELEKADIEAIVEVSTLQQWARDIIVVRVKGHVWGETLCHRVIRHPLNWIEAVKDRWLPWWLRRRWPVKWQEHHIEAKAYYPGERPSMPDRPWRIAAYLRHGVTPCAGQAPDEW